MAKGTTEIKACIFVISTLPEVNEFKMFALNSYFAFFFSSFVLQTNLNTHIHTGRHRHTHTLKKRKHFLMKNVF